jgi:hypothetical protein
MRTLYSSLVTLALFTMASGALAQEPAGEADTARRDRVIAAAAPYIDGETFAIAYFDLDTAWVDGTQKMIPTLLGAEGNKMAAHPGFAIARQMVKQLEDAGAEEMVVMMSLLDLHASGGPVAIVTTSDPAKSHKVEELVKAFISFDKRNENVRAVSLRDARGSVVVASQTILDRVQASKPVERPHLTLPLSQLLEDNRSAGEAGIVISMGNDARRVVRELFPQLPRPVEKLNGTLLADDLLYDSIAISSPPEWQINWHAQLRHADAARVLKESFEVGLEFGVNQIPASEGEMAEAMRAVAREIKIVQEDSQLSMTLAHDNEMIGQIVENVLGRAIQDARNTARRNQQVNNFKQVALAMHNFESIQKHFPAATAIVDKEGKPLLSWRVAILPVLEGDDHLFDKFRLDEPWDSEHNLKLAKQMPAVFADPRHPELAAAGKTTCMLPVHSEGAFRPLAELGAPAEATLRMKKLFLMKGPDFREITDGTSNTIMHIEVAPERAVVWTRPDDWEVDLNKPLEGLASPGRKEATATMFDGSAHTLDLSMDPAVLRGMLTRAGQEAPK